MRRLLVVLALAAGCASSTNAPPAGPDLAVPMCDRKLLFSQCSSQCGFKVCGIGVATCMGSAWSCDCGQAVPCSSTD
jgi:hypothetical protein